MAQHTAIVIGSGMAGLATAQALSKHFDRVLVLERDVDPASDPAIVNKSAVEVASMKPPARPGVSQYKHIHVMMAQGAIVMDKRFEGCFLKQVTAAGGRFASMPGQLLCFHPLTGLLPWRRNLDPTVKTRVLCATRHLLESTARRLLADNPHVEVMYEAAVTGLVFDSQHEEEKDGDRDKAAQADPGTAAQWRVSGVVLSDGRRLCARLVVDCSGRGSALPSWLAAAGYNRPHTTRAGCNCGYASCLVKLDPATEAQLESAGVSGVIILPCAPEPAFFLLAHVEGGAWTLGMGGMEGNHPSRDDAELLNFAETRIWHPVAGRLLRGFTQLSPASHMYGITGTWRHYERISLPDGLLVLGDGICSLNPTYGQGMSVAVMEASALDAILSKRTKQPAHGASPRSGCSGCSGSSGDGCPVWLQGLHQEFQLAILQTVQGVWQLAAGADLRYPSAVTNDPVNMSVVERLVSEYVQLIFVVAADDPTVNQAFMRVMSLMAPPESLMHPGVIFRVLYSQAGTVLRGVLNACLPAWLQSKSALQQPEAADPKAAGGSRSSQGVAWPEGVLRLVGAVSG